MTKHVHAEMIKAKVDNMDLVVFVKGESWTELPKNAFTLTAAHEFFMCLPQHKDACLHWLNGGEAQFEYDENWHSCSEWSKDWYLPTCGFMQEGNVIRIKPKKGKEKEKRWIGVRSDGYTTRAYDSEHDCSDETDRRTDYDGIMGWEIIEIEVEV